MAEEFERVGAPLSPDLAGIVEVGIEFLESEHATPFEKQIPRAKGPRDDNQKSRFFAPEGARNEKENSESDGSARLKSRP